MVEALLWCSRVLEDTAGASAMLEKEEKTGFTMRGETQQGTLKSLG